MSPKPPAQPEHGRLLQAFRERRGLTRRQAARFAGVSDSYWGQVERGYQEAKGQIRDIRPTRQMLLQMAEVLRLDRRETNAVMEAAGERPVSTTDGSVPRGVDVDLTGLSKRDVSLLNAIADRFREATPIEDAPPLRAVAQRGQRKDAPTASQQAKDQRRKQTGGRP